jgi:hypothetical protein
MWHRRLVSIPVILALMNSWLYASVVPGLWEKVEALERGSKIIVTLDTGDILQGEYTALERESIRMIVDNREREYPKEAVTQISQLKLGWSRKKKAGVGALIGSAVGFGIGAAIGGSIESEFSAGGGIFLGVIGGGIGAAAGLQKQSSKEIVIYEANSTSVLNMTE